jgi:hypothetical protein
VLAVALTLLEEETCNGCGTPLWIGHSTDNTIAFEVKSSVCYGCAELEKDREQQQNRQKPSRGETRYVDAYSVWGDPLPSRFESYAREDD